MSAQRTSNTGALTVIPQRQGYSNKTSPTSTASKSSDAFFHPPSNRTDIALHLPPRHPRASFLFPSNSCLASFDREFRFSVVLPVRSPIISLPVVTPSSAPCQSKQIFVLARLDALTAFLIGPSHKTYFEEDNVKRTTPTHPKTSFAEPLFSLWKPSVSSASTGTLKEYKVHIECSPADFYKKTRCRRFPQRHTHVFIPSLSGSFLALEPHWFNAFVPRTLGDIYDCAVPELADSFRSIHGHSSVLPWLFLPPAFLSHFTEQMYSCYTFSVHRSPAQENFLLLLYRTSIYCKNPAKPTNIGPVATPSQLRRKRRYCNICPGLVQRHYCTL